MPKGSMSLVRIPKINILTLGERFRKETLVYIKHYAILYGESSKIVLVPQKIIAFLEKVYLVS